VLSGQCFCYLVRYRDVRYRDVRYWNVCYWD